MTARRGLAIVIAAVAASFVGLPANGSTVAGSSSQRETFSVTYTPNTVVVPASVVSAELVGVSPDGSTFTFKGASGPLASLTAGKVMLLENKAVGVVTGVSKSGGGLVVKTRQPLITDVVKSGTIAVNEPVTFAGGTIAPQSEAPPDVTFKSTRLTASGYSAAREAEERAATMRLSGAYNGSVGPIDYSATLDKAGDKLDFDVTYKFDKNDLEGTVNVQGYVDTFDATLDMIIKNGHVASSQFLAKPLNGHMHVTWTLGRGETSNYTIKVPVFTLPFSFNWPFIVGGFPFFVKVDFQTLMTIAISARNGIIQGGAELDYNGSGGGLTTGGALTKEGAERMAGQFLSSAGSLTLASSAAVLAFDAPKITLGIGLPTLLNGTGYVDVISSLGQTTGSAVAGQSCSKYDVDFTVKAGAGAELFKSFSLPDKVIFTKSASRTEGAGPGC